MLAEALLASLFGGRSFRLRAQLVEGNRPVADPVRLPPGAWSLSGARAVASPHFGPFVQSVTFDGVALYDGEGTQIEVFPLAQTTLGPGTSYEHEILVAVG